MDRVQEAARVAGAAGVDAVNGEVEELAGGDADAELHVVFALDPDGVEVGRRRLVAGVNQRARVGEGAEIEVARSGARADGDRLGVAVVGLLAGVGVAGGDVDVVGAGGEAADLHAHAVLAGGVAAENTALRDIVVEIDAGVAGGAEGAGARGLGGEIDRAGGGDAEIHAHAAGGGGAVAVKEGGRGGDVACSDGVPVAVGEA